MGSDGSGDGTATYTTANLTATNNYFKALVTNGSCTAAFSTYANVTTLIAQTITLASTDSKVFGSDSYTLTASTDHVDAAYPLSYSVISGTAASIDAATGLVTINSVGTVTIQVSQAGDGTTYDDATPQTQTLTISLTTPGTFTYNGTAQGPASVASQSRSGSVTFTYTGVSPTVYTTSTTKPTAAGSYTVTATLAAAGNYAAATDSKSFTIGTAALTVTANNAVKVLGTTLSLGTTAFTITSGSLFGTDAITGVTLTSTGSASGAACGTYSIVPSAPTGSGLSNYTITPANGTLTVGTQYTETFTTTGGTGLNTHFGSPGAFYTGTGATATSGPLAWASSGNGAGTSNTSINSGSSVNTPCIKFPHSSGSAVGYITTTLHGVVNIGYYGLTTTISDNLTLTGNSVLNYVNPIAITTGGTIGSTPVSSANDSVFTFSYATNGAGSALLDNVSFTFATPVSQIVSSSLNFSNVNTTGTTINWTRPNSGIDNQGAIVFVGDASTATWSAPSNGTSYTANTTFGSGTQIGTSGYYCVYSGKLSSVILSGLTSNKTYKVYVMEYNGIAGLSDEVYRSADALSSSQLIPTCNTPTLSTVSQSGTGCVSAGATISLTGLVPSTSGLTVSYTINNGTVQTATGVIADASGNATFTTANLTITNNGQTLAVTKIADGTCNTPFSSSNTCTLSVIAASAAGTVASAQSICSGNTPADLTLSGNNGTTIQWQSSTTSASAGFSNLAGATSTTLSGSTIGSLNVSTWFRATVQNTSSCSVATATAVKITVNANPTITSTGTVNTVCYSASAQTSTLAYTATTGTPTSYSIAWDANAIAAQASTTTTFATGAGTVTTIAIPAATAGNTYNGTLTVKTANACTATMPVTITVLAAPSAGTAAYNGTSVCNESQLTDNITLGSTGTTGAVTKWQYSTNSGTSWTDIASSASSTLSPATVGNLSTGSYQFQAIVTNGAGCTVSIASNAVSVNVNAIPTPTFTSSKPTATINTNATYTTQSSQSNYVWNIDGILNTDYQIVSGGLGSTNASATVKWIKTGTYHVTVNYTSNSCTAVTAASTTTDVSPLSAPPVLTAATGATVDNYFDITYTINPAGTNWKNAITDIP